MRWLHGGLDIEGAGTHLRRLKRDQASYRTRSLTRIIASALLPPAVERLLMVEPTGL